MRDPKTIAGEIIDRWLASVKTWTGSAKRDTATMEQLIADAINSERADAAADRAHLEARVNEAEKQRDELRAKLDRERLEAEDLLNRICARLPVHAGEDVFDGIARLAQQRDEATERCARIVEEEAIDLRATAERSQAAKEGLIALGMSPSENDGHVPEIAGRLAGWFEDVARKIRSGVQPTTATAKQGAHEGDRP